MARRPDHSECRTDNGGVSRPADGQGPETVYFPARDSDLTGALPTQLEGLLLWPAGRGPFPAIVLMHGCDGLYSGGTLSSHYGGWAEQFRRGGYAVLLVDSFTPRGVDEVCSNNSRSVRPGYERARDVYAALRYLKTQSRVRADRIGVMGWSHGASSVLWAVNRFAKARPRGLKRDFAAAAAFYPGMCSAMLTFEHGWASTIPLLVLLGAKDNWTPARPCVDLVERSKRDRQPVEVVVYSGAYHAFDAPGSPLRTVHNIATTDTGAATVGTDPAARADALMRVPRFFDDHLRPDGDDSRSQAS